MLLAYWVHDLSPFVVRFWGDVGIRWYGLAYVCGFFAGWWLMVRYWRAGRSALAAPKVADFIMALVAGVILGGRLGYFLFYDLEQLVYDPLVLFRVWDGGMASHGGFIGVALAAWWYSRHSRLPFLHLADLSVTTAPVGLMLGRIANFINGELWGKTASVPWAVIFPKSEAPGTPLHLIPPRHPSQLYEAALEGALLLAYLQWRFWKSNAAERQPGRLSGEFLVAYAVARVVCEAFREPDAGVPLILGLSRGTFYSLFLIAAGAGLIAYAVHAGKAREKRPGAAA